MNKKIAFTKLSEDFLNVRSITREKGTFKGDKTHIKYFGQWLNTHKLDDTPFKKINKHHIEEFSLYLASSKEKGGKDLDRGSCTKYYDTLCNLYNFAREQNIVDKKPLKLFKLPVQKKDHSAELIPEHKLSELLLDIQENDFQLFVASILVLACGLRPRKELRLRKVKDFNIEEGFVRIPVTASKVHKTRIVTIPKYVIEILLEYGINKSDGESYLFGANHSFDIKPLSENMFCYRFNKFRDKHNLSKGVVFYSLKPNGGKLFLEAVNGNVVALMEHFGHSKLTTTQIYVSKKLGLVNSRYQQNAIDPRTLVCQY
jgi:site-specific recombinase XerD